MIVRRFRSNSSGQVIIVSALLVSALFLSTAIYVIELGKEVPTLDPSQTDVFSAYKQSTESTLISALANASSGGNLNILSTDLNELKMAILSNSYQAMLTLDCMPLNSGGYHDGLLISWGNNGQGVSSSCAFFVFHSQSPIASSNLEYNLNVTSSVNLRASCNQLDDTTKKATLIVKVQNEGKPALAQNFTVSYQNGADWTTVDSPSITSFGDGTYTLTFNAQQSQPSDPLILNLLCQDQRGIFVGANLTCTSN